MSAHKKQNYSVHRKDGIPGQCVCVFPSACAHTRNISRARAGQRDSGEREFEQREQGQLLSPRQHGCTAHQLSGMGLYTEFMSS